MSKIADGRALPGTDVIATDAVALLAGVSFNSTRKVLIALGLMHKAACISYDVLLDADAIPKYAAETERRLDATTDFVHDLLPNPIFRSAQDDLKLRRFFSN